MGESVYQGLTVGYCYALTQFLMVFVLGIWYLRKSENEFDPLADAVVAARPTPRGDDVRFVRRRRDGGRAMIALRGGQRRSAGDGGDHPRHHARHHASGRPRRASSAVGFYAAGRQITGRQNGLAISGDYLSAASFLGIAGLIFLYGFDGFLYSIGFLVAFLTVMFLLAERMRNAGKYTIADVLSFRLNETPARAAAALGTFAVVTFYLIAQMVGAGVLIEKLVGINFSLAVIVTGVFMLCYVIFGGMVATTWVQIVKAVLLMAGIFTMSVFVLGQGRLQPDRAVQPRGREQGRRSPRSRSAPGTYLPKPLDTVSLGPGARARHRRPAAHPDALLHRAQRQGRAFVRGVGDVHHRLLLPADDVHRLRRARLPG